VAYWYCSNSDGYNTPQWLAGRQIRPPPPIEPRCRLCINIPHYPHPNRNPIPNPKPNPNPKSYPNLKLFNE